MKMIKLLASALTKNKKLTAALTFLLLAVIVLSFLRAYDVQTNKQMIAATEQAALETVLGEEVSASEAEALLTEEDKRAIGAYSGATLELQQKLADSTFVTKGETSVLIFNRATYQTTDGTGRESKEQTYVIGLCEKSIDTSIEQVKKTIYNAVVKLGDTQAFLTFTIYEFIAEDGTAKATEETLACSALPEKATYMKVVNLKPVNVEGIAGSELGKLLGETGTKHVEQAIVDYAMKNCPKATVACWLEIVAIDYGTSITEAYFSIDGEGVKQIAVTYDENTKTATVKMGVLGR